ncbi:MAG: hypothetical protein L6Q33_00470 [Bacteriovoracaceae bacterium]|nr:hypothetical protein [Bacteriovoracaceae bacterium]
MKKNIFIDFEYANRKLDITEVGVSYIDEKNEAKLLYHSYIKLNNEIDIDPITFKVAKIPLQTLNKSGKHIDEIKMKLNDILRDSNVFHWSGAEKRILNKQLDIKKIATINDLSKEDYVSHKKLIICFKECFPSCSRLNIDIHSAELDSFLSALIYKKINLKLEITQTELEFIKNKIIEKDKIIKLFKENEKELRRNAYGDKDGIYFNKKISVYFSGYRDDQKETLIQKYKGLGITVMGNKDRADFIIFKNIHEPRVQKYKERALTLDDFVLLLKTGEVKMAS